MELKVFSKEQLMDFLTNGIPMPETAYLNKDTINFYFEELEGFINTAENEYLARAENTAELIVAFDEKDYIVMRVIGTKLVFFMTPEVGSQIEAMSSIEAENIIGLVYGVVVYNEKWNEVSELANKILDSAKTDGKPIKMNSIEMEHLKEFITNNKKYK
jgi:hypothetical protein|tara:strand:+ start:54 stop:530 length:477 start_codon:yes stop_codon:yes gene_type:complete